MSTGRVMYKAKKKVIIFLNEHQDARIKIGNYTDAAAVRRIRKNYSINSSW